MKMCFECVLSSIVAFPAGPVGPRPPEFPAHDFVHTRTGGDPEPVKGMCGRNLKTGWPALVKFAGTRVLWQGREDDGGWRMPCRRFDPPVAGEPMRTDDHGQAVP
jgi:hypothetical protein